MGYIGSGPTRFNTADELTVTGDAEFNGNLTVKGTTTTIDSASVQTVDLGDNDKIRLGDGDDLQIYHNGSASVISDVGTGNFFISGDNDVFISKADLSEVKAKFSTNGAVTLYYDSAAKLTTTATGVDVTGTVTADGLTVDGTSQFNTGRTFITGGNEPYVLGVGRNGNTNSYYLGVHSSTTPDLIFSNNAGTENVRFTYNGKVGIGQSSPQSYINSGTKVLHLKQDSVNGSGLVMESDSCITEILSGSNASYFYNYTSDPMVFGTNNTERMRINSSGQLIVGHTGAGSPYFNEGIVLNPAGDSVFHRDGNSVVDFSRETSDGSIVRFVKDNSVVGSINVEGGDLCIGTDDSGLQFNNNANSIRPFNIGTNAASDNFLDLGQSGDRFDDIYATNGTIQTSDANEKQQIAALTNAEITAAKAISQLFKTFKWRDKVAAKGDAARTHAGVIAQDVQAAMTAAGLDAGDYAFFISSTWWETQTEVPAVEAVEAVDAVYEDVVIPAVEEELDEDGNVIVEAQPERTEQRLVSEAIEAVEAKEAYTRTDTYDTAEEAPEGATERTRLGIRYPELLAFVGAATEQRLANIETRLTALETA